MVKPDGPIPYNIMIVGEAPGAEEEARGVPFCGASGMELNKMLHEAGITRSECFVTNVARERPYNNDIGNFIAMKKKDITSGHSRLRDKWVRPPVLEGCRLLQLEIKMVQPTIIIALGNTALLALTGIWGVTKWRGSMLHTDLPGGTKVIPTLHPAAILRQWSDRNIAVNDLKPAAKFRNGENYPDPGWRFSIRPTYLEVTETPRRLINEPDFGPPLDISFDLEAELGHIDGARLPCSLAVAIRIHST